MTEFAIFGIKIEKLNSYSKKFFKKVKGKLSIRKQYIEIVSEFYASDTLDSLTFINPINNEKYSVEMNCDGGETFLVMTSIDMNKGEKKISIEQMQALSEFAKKYLECHNGFVLNWGLY